MNWGAKEDVQLQLIFGQDLAEMDPRTSKPVPEQFAICPFLAITPTNWCGDANTFHPLKIAEVFGAAEG